MYAPGPPAAQSLVFKWIIWYRAERWQAEEEAMKEASMLLHVSDGSEHGWESDWASGLARRQRCSIC